MLAKLAGYLKIDFVWEVSMCVCVSVCPPPRLLITSGVMWCDMGLCDWLNKFYNFYTSL